MDFKGPTRRNKQYCVVGKPLDCSGGYNVDLLISRYIDYNIMVLIKGVEQDPGLKVKLLIHKLTMIARIQIVRKRKIRTRIPLRHHMMVKIRMILIMMR